MSTDIPMRLPPARAPQPAHIIPFLPVPNHQSATYLLEILNWNTDSFGNPQALPVPGLHTALNLKKLFSTRGFLQEATIASSFCLMMPRHTDPRIVSTPEPDTYDLLLEVYRRCLGWLEPEVIEATAVLFGIGMNSTVPALFWSNPMHFGQALISIVTRADATLGRRLSLSIVARNTRRLRQRLQKRGCFVGRLPLDIAVMPAEESSIVDPGAWDFGERREMSASLQANQATFLSQFRAHLETQGNPERESRVERFRFEEAEYRYMESDLIDALNHAAENAEEWDGKAFVGQLGIGKVACSRYEGKEWGHHDGEYKVTVD